MPIVQRINPCLWFDSQAEKVVASYTAIFRNSRILDISRYGEAGREIHGKPPGTVMTVAFELDGQRFTALNGGPLFKFNEAVSFATARKHETYTTPDSSPESWQVSQSASVRRPVSS